MRYYLIAGEASGDLHGSNLMNALREQDSDAEFRFFGGELMQAAGGTLVRHYRELAYMGFWPVITHLHTILSNGRQCFDDITAWNPDAVILIDYPGFNLGIARLVKSRLHIPVFYYISPKLWAWKGYRIKNIKRDVTALFSILPFETPYFAERGYKAVYVGNPCVDAIAQYRSLSPSANSGESSGKPVIALLAGSRRQEISRNLPHMLEAVRGLDGYEIVLAAAPGIDDSFYSRILDKSRMKIRVERGRTYSVLDGARAALVTSGTATLETALLKVPQVVCYRLPADMVTRQFQRFILKTRFVSLVNLITGQETVPELLGSYMNGENVRAHLLPLLDMDSAVRQSQLDGYDSLIRTLGPAGASRNTASGIVDFLKGNQ